ncbi:MAG TPA: hypothetical protein VGO58_03755 [Chitinophagaceae bacterium]|jgi:hypothetical protein|nr:hypothetical protein [Chitinophagaceae bacterium]
MYIPNSYIKEVAIEIDPEYEFDNSPYPIPEEEKKRWHRKLFEWCSNLFKKKPEKKEKIFLGRDRNKAKLIEFLKNERGVYLVTGYRGMGKTSFVNRSIEDYRQASKKESKKGKKQVYDINITLTQSELNEFDILRLMVSKVFSRFKKHKRKEKRNSWLRIYKKLFIYTGAILIALISIMLFKEAEFEKLITIDWFDRIEWWPAAHTGIKGLFMILVACCALYGGFRVVNHFWKRKENANFKKIENLVVRCHSSVVKEQAAQMEAVLETFSTKLSAFHEKETQSFPIASTKEIEHELGEFLKDVSGEMQFIFIFDELDKVEPAVVTTSYYQEIEAFEKAKPDNTYLHQLRDRKQAVLNIISGLKNFLTTARSNFIFIAGREMFDASLADIADRQSSVSSMFNYVFYIDSLSKEKFYPSDSASLSNVIEEYLKRIMFPADPLSSKEEKEEYDKKSLFRLLNETGELEDKTEEALQRSKIITMVQNFIIYLTYRSNGSPKKLIRSIHEFITIGDLQKTKAPNAKYLRVLLSRRGKEESTKNKKYLFFNYQDQYRIGFINYLYRPFLVRYGRSLKENSDSIIVATPYLFDHLLKFHPFAFSLTNLELIPEVLATTKTPSLKEHIRVIIDYLCHNHIRETEIGLFDYKYYSRTLNELSFISKTFEEESAAFNFTLDESYLVKLHVRSKIKELRSIYARYTEKLTLDSQIVFSIAHLNGTLGDLHFFDEEYDDAIIAYSDAIKPIDSLDIPKMSMRDFITLIRNKLKLGLCFEKINSYEESLAFYTDAAQDAKRFITYNISCGQHVYPLPKPEALNKPEMPATFYSSSMSDVLQIVNQAFLAKLIVQEKMGIEGLTAHKVALACGGFLQLAGAIKKYCGKNYLIHANFYLMIGNILYFKNDNIIVEKKGSGGPGEGKLDLGDSTIPEEVDDLFRSLYGFRLSNSMSSGEKHVAVEPSLPICFYILGLLEVLESKQIDGLDRIKKYILNRGNINKNIVSELLGVLSHENVRKQTKFSKYHFKYIAIFLSNLGDCLLGIYKNSEGRIRSLTDIFNEQKANSFERSDPGIFIDYLVPDDKSAFGIADVLRCYHLSAVYFKMRGRNVSSSFQYRKILYTLNRVLVKDIHEKDRNGKKTDDTNNIPNENPGDIRNNVRHDGNKHRKKMEFHSKVLGILDTTIVSKILVITSQNSEFSDRHMIRKFQKHDISERYARNNISNHPESREAILLYAYLRLKLLGEGDEQLVNHYNSIATQFTRILEVEYFSKCAYYKLAKIESTGFEGNETNIKIVVDYIYSLVSLIRTLNIYGTDYLVGLSHRAYVHYQLATALETYSKENINVDIIERVQGILNNTETFGIANAIYNYQMANQYYVRARQLHSNGAEYKNSLDKILYLEDDINDNAAHFGAALERYILNNLKEPESFKKKCEEKLKAYKESDFSYDSFVRDV